MNRNKYQTEYKKQNYKRIPLDLRYDDYEKLKACADSVNESVNGFIKKAILMRIEKTS